MSFGAYLAGTWEKRFGLDTTIQIVNPTVEDLEVTVAFLDNNEKFLTCVKNELSPNDLWEIVMPEELKESRGFGVIKAISHRRNEVMPGIIGFKRHFLVVPGGKVPEIAFSEAPLAAMPLEIAKQEYRRFQDKCPH